MCVSGDTVKLEWYDSGQGPDHAQLVVTGAAFTQPTYNNSRANYYSTTLYNISEAGASVHVKYTGVYWLYNDSAHRSKLNVVFAGSGPETTVTVEEDQVFNSNIEHRQSLVPGNNWHHAWTIGGKESDHAGFALPATDDAGNPYVYYLVELDSNGNEVQIGGSPSDGVTLVGYSDNNADGVSGQGVLTVTNQIDSTSITITKVAADDLENANAEPLPGATFKLEKYVSADYAQKVDNWEREIADTTGTGVFEFTGLGAGFYKIIEVKSPDGYIKQSDDPTFQIVQNGDDLQVVFTDTDTVKYTAQNGFRFGNTPGTPLPHTGGLGVVPFAAVGSALVAIAFAILIRRRGRA